MNYISKPEYNSWYGEYRVGWTAGNCGSIPGMGKVFLLSKVSRSALGPPRLPSSLYQEQFLWGLAVGL